MDGTPFFFRPSAAGINSLHLSRHVLVGVEQLLAPRESASSNLQKLPGLASSFHEMKNQRTALLNVICPSTARSMPGRRSKNLTIAQWNVRTLLDRDEASGPEGRAAPAAVELAKVSDGHRCPL